MELKSTAINNRRYLGNKYKLLPFITKVVRENCHDINTFADLFATSYTVTTFVIWHGLVPRNLIQKKLSLLLLLIIQFRQTN